MTIRELRDELKAAVSHHYDEREAHQIALLTAAHLLGMGTQTALLVADPQREVTIEEELLRHTLEQLSAGIPMQYVLGQTDFYGRQFKVDQRVLIPRPETEELVDWISRAEPSAERILDIGTGSGCIAISLALEKPASRVWALDISPEALEVARENNRCLGAGVNFVEGDALGPMEGLFEEKFDVVVSNPPYVPASDLEQMDANVRDHEPHLALFVPDDDQLRFYRAIARQGQHLLRDEGRLYFEIYHTTADAMHRMLTEEGYCAIEIRRDLSDKPRMVCCRKSR